LPSCSLTISGFGVALEARRDDHGDDRGEEDADTLHGKDGSNEGTTVALGGILGHVCGAEGAAREIRII